MTDLSIMNNLRLKAPSIFAEEPYGGMSNKYKFIPTSEVVEKLLDEGFIISKFQENRVRNEDKHGFAKHMIRFRQPNLAPQVGDIIPEVVLTNSHDGTSAFQLSAGLYRLVCSNGMVVGNDMVNVRQRHSGNVGDVIEGVFSVLDEIPAVIDTAQRWQGITLTQNQQRIFAQAALPLRWEADQNGNLPVDAVQILRPRRQADVAPTLWNTFNIMQEHIIKGGVRARSSNGHRRSSKAVNSVSEDTRLNKALWTLASEMEKLAA